MPDSDSSHPRHQSDEFRGRGSAPHIGHERGAEHPAPARTSSRSRHPRGLKDVYEDPRERDRPVRRRRQCDRRRRPRARLMDDAPCYHGDAREGPDETCAGFRSPARLPADADGEAVVALVNAERARRRVPRHAGERLRRSAGCAGPRIEACDSACSMCASRPSPPPPPGSILQSAGCRWRGAGVRDAAGACPDVALPTRKNRPDA